MTLPEYASVGRVRRPHGVRGELVVEALTDEPDAIFAPGRRVFQGTHEGELWLDPRARTPRELTVTGLRPFKEGWLVTFDSVTDRNEAERWNGRHLMVPVDELSEPEEGEVFAHELIGMMLVDADTRGELGEVVEYYELPQGLLLEFRHGGGTARLPFIDEFVDEVDREARRIVVRPPEGLLEGDTSEALSQARLEGDASETLSQARLEGDTSETSPTKGPGAGSADMPSKSVE